MNERPKITQEMIDLYDDYTHLTLDRRGFIKLGAGVGAVAMSALEAGQILAQGTPGKGKSIDLHTHWTPPAYNEAISKLHMPPEAATGTSAFGAADAPSVNLEKRVAWMDSHGVQMHVLTLSGGTSIAFSPSAIGFEITRPRFFAIASSNPVSTTKLPCGPVIAQTK